MTRLRSAPLCLDTLLCMLVAATCGCSTLVVSHDYDTKADFTALKTYTWLEPPEDPIDDPRVNISLFESRLERAVNEVLAEKGFKLLDSQEEGIQPDFYMGYFVTLDRQVDVNVVNNYHGYGWMRGPHVYVEEYDEGTVILDVVDATSKSIIWRGMATDRVDFLSSPGKREETVRTAVTRMLEPFPPPDDE